MKNLILILSLCIFLFSCFEKEEEVTVIDETPIENPADTTANDTTDVVITPIDSVDIMQCENVKQIMVNYILSNPPKEPRAYSIKYIYNNEYVLFLDPGGEEGGSAGVTNSNCRLICEFGGSAGNTCYDFWEKAVFIDTVWVDRR